VVAILEETFRDEWGRVLASLIGLLGDFDRAEEATQEAFAIAAERWPRDGVPDNPRAWLVTTARNRALDRIRRERTFEAKARELGVPDAWEDELDDLDATTIPDERLELVFTCCHPALALDVQVALTLRTLGGLRTEEIARAFLVADETMAKRLVRAKHKIKAAGIPFRVPPAHLLPDRLDAVVAVVYLIFNEGYTHPPTRGDLASEAIRLGRALAELMPDEPEVHGLLALMTINDSRRTARFADGAVVLLRDQDRSLWDRDQIATGRAALERALALRGRGSYVLQAAIADLHAEDPPDWPQIAALYGELARLTGSAVVELNQAATIERRATPRPRSRWPTASTSTATTTCTRPVPSCCAGSAGSTTPAPPTSARWRSSTQTPSAASSNNGWLSSAAERRSSLALARRVAVVEHQVVAVGVAEQRHVTDAGVEGVAGELDALGLQLGARRGDVVDVQRRVRVALRGELHPHLLRLPDPEARVADPELELRAVVRPQAERIDVEAP